MHTLDKNRSEGMKAQARILDKYMSTAPIGKVEWIGLRPAHKSAMLTQSAVEAIAGKGLEGDHQSSRSNGSTRQVTLINAEDIRALEQLMNLTEIHPQRLRRNIVVSGLNLHAMRYQLLRIGSALSRVQAHCHPCLRMERELGESALLSMYGRGGYCAVVEEGGTIALGDCVERVGQANLI